VTLAVDFAADPNGTRIAVAVPGNWGLPDWSVRLYERAQLELDAQDAETLAAEVDANIEAARGAAAHGAGGQLGTGIQPHNERCGGTSAGVNPEGQATAVAFVTAERLAVQTREPAQLYLYDVPALLAVAQAMPSTAVPTVIALAAESRQDTGHDMFHLRAGARIACASCHAEGGDDGHVWTFEDLGPRRTQHVRGGLLGTEPLHWGGDMATFAELAKEVFVGRMGGFDASDEHIAAAARWIDLQPALARSVRDADAVERGRVLFMSEAVGCAKCHAGAALTNNQSEDVGTGGPLQVPSLRGVAFRAPYMHDGCATTLRDRFGPCGGGDRHGTTSALDDDEIQDLIAYLESL
jgi:cytochrome c